MRWIAVSLGATVAAAALAWALVTTGHWPLDDRMQPATAVYLLNGALGQWLSDHGGEVPQGAGERPPGLAAPGAAAQGLTGAELDAVRQTLRTDPRFSGRYRFTPVPKTGPSGRG